MELYIELALVGLKGNGEGTIAGVPIVYRPVAKFSLIGESVLGSNDILVGERRSPMPSNPKPAATSGRESSGGGVGVRGGAGIGIFIAMLRYFDYMLELWHVILYSKSPTCTHVETCGPDKPRKSGEMVLIYSLVVLDFLFAIEELILFTNSGWAGIRSGLRYSRASSSSYYGPTEYSVE